MRKRWATGGLLGLLVLGIGLLPSFAGDSFYGKVTEVKSAEIVVLGPYNIRIVGVDSPEAGALAMEARKFLANLVLGKNVRMRFEYRARNGEMVSRLFTDDPVIGIKDVGVELVKAGLARRRRNYDYKYGELSAAENQARTAKRGLWATSQPR